LKSTEAKTKLQCGSAGIRFYPLEGQNLVRFVFMDESGISNQEPVAIVSGVVVHADSQIVPLEDHLGELIEKHIPRPDQEGFAFHATDIWTGKGYFKDREVWPWERRAAILDDLVLIPEKLDIPVIFGRMPKEEMRREHPSAPNWTGRELAVNAHAIAFLHCVLNIEEYMRLVWQDEIAQLVSEDNSDARAVIKGCYALLRAPRKNLGQSEFIPLKQIKGPVLFADKGESRPLQLADTCAFLIRRRLDQNDERGRRFYSKLRSMMLLLPKGDDVWSSLKTLYPFGPLSFL
jgi:hypothetical protein